MAKRSAATYQGNTLRIDLQWFDGINSLAGYGIAKRSDLWHGENARSRQPGIIDKREGIAIIGNDIGATTNWDLIDFRNSGVDNTGLYRISTVAGSTGIYYLKASTQIWTLMYTLGGLLELGDATTQYDVSNPSGTTFRYTWDGTGTDPLMSKKIHVGTVLNIQGDGFSVANKGTFTVTGTGTNYFEITNAAGVVESNKVLGSARIRITSATFSHAVANGYLFIVNGETTNLCIDPDGLTVKTETTADSNVTNSPRARKVSYYKDKVYLADIVIGDIRYPEKIQSSSEPLGITSLVSNDYPAGTYLIEVSDAKYVNVGGIINIYRESTLIDTLTVEAKSSTFILFTSPTTNALLAADEIWFESTFDGNRKFLWASNQGTDGILAFGDGSSQFDITNPSGVTFRYTWDGSGTNPFPVGKKPGIGMTIQINGQNFTQGTPVQNLGDATTMWDITNFIVNLGDTTTQWTISNTSGSTWRYTYTGSGTDPTVGSNVVVGNSVNITAGGFNAANRGIFAVTAKSTNYFEVTNSSGVAQTNVFTSSGFIRSNHTTTFRYAWNGTGTNPGIGAVVTIGTLLDVQAQNFSSANKGRFTVIAFNNDSFYPGGSFDVTNVGVVEANKTTGTGYVRTVSRTNNGTFDVTGTGTNYFEISNSAGIEENNKTLGTGYIRAYGLSISHQNQKLYDTFDLSGGQTARIKLLETIGDVLVIANDNNMSTWDNYTQRIFDIGIGCVADRGHVKAYGSLWFLHSSGIYSFGGDGLPKIVSSPVSRYVAGATLAGLQASVMGKKGFSVFATLGDVSLYHEDGSLEKVAASSALEYDLRKKASYFHTDMPVQFMETYVSTSDSDVFTVMRSDTFNVYEMFVGSTDIISPAYDNVICWRMDTPRLYFSAQYNRFGVPKTIGIECDRGGGLECFISLDGKPFYKLDGVFRKGLNMLVFNGIDEDHMTPARSRYIIVSLRDTTRQTVRVSRLFVDYIEAVEGENLSDFDVNSS